ncbi:MAG: hypothetical protein FWC41_12845 [Firmicutes bacterium]|nr:hypothetical protein [Bacillota bacterium]
MKFRSKFDRVVAKTKNQFIYFLYKCLKNRFPKTAEKITKWKLEAIAKETLKKNPNAYKELNKMLIEMAEKIKDSPFVFDENEKREFGLQLFIQYAFRYLILEYSKNKISVSHLEKEVIKHLPEELSYACTDKEPSLEFQYMIDNNYIEIVVNNTSLRDSIVHITKKGQKAYDEHIFVNLASSFYYAYSERINMERSLSLSENNLKSTNSMLKITKLTLLLSFIAICFSTYNIFFNNNKNNEVIINEISEIKKQIEKITIPSKVEAIITNDTLNVKITNPKAIH